MSTTQEWPVVLVHGIWMTGLEMRLLGGRLKGCGYSPHYFHYPSLSESPQDSAVGLDAFVRDIGSDSVHIVAHSLGGIVTLHLFDLFPDQPPGRVVLLGSPVQGSGVARVIESQSWMRPVLGRNAEGGLLQPAPEWKCEREIGTLAGTSSLGVGNLVGGLQEKNDGTVSVTETCLAGARDSCQLDVSHMGMLLSRKVADQVCSFLQYGHFRLN